MPIDGQWRNPAMRRCDRNIAYGSWRRAESRAQKVSGKTGELIIAYQCYDCGKFHIGHADESQKIVRKTKEHALQACCPNCKGPIPPDRRAATEANGSSIMYCSNECHNAWGQEETRGSSTLGLEGGQRECNRIRISLMTNLTTNCSMHSWMADRSPTSRRFATAIAFRLPKVDRRRKIVIACGPLHA